METKFKNPIEYIIDVLAALSSFTKDPSDYAVIIPDSVAQQVTPAKPQTNEELARELLKKNGYCLTHLVKREFSKDPLYAQMYICPPLVCPVCNQIETESRKLREQLERDKTQAEVNYAIGILSISPVCNSENHQ